ncbi:MAG: SIS domain-containing protein [Chloroflexota bacterium]|nr:MAG: SIS domain-containing protein [Chloroflexota bacterium]
MKSVYEEEIFQQPDVIRNVVITKSAQIASLAINILKKPPKFIMIAARGTSDNAAIYAKYLFTGINRIPVGLAMPSLFTLYQQKPILEEGLVIGISQSGQTPDVHAVLEEANRQGVPTISITNTEESPLASLADFNIIVDAGEERSVAASKTYTSQLTVIAMLSAFLSRDDKSIDDLQRLANYVDEALSQMHVTKLISSRLKEKDHIAIVGRGFNYCTTHEIALKIKELSYMIAQSYSAADFRHGPIAMLEPGFPVVAIAVKGKALTDMESMIKSIQWTDADLEIMTNAPWLMKITKNPILLPEEMPEWLSPIVSTIPGQMLALNLSLAKGIDPDKPRGLKKVTLTY